MPNKRELHEQLFHRADMFSKAVEKFTRPLLDSIASREAAQQLRDSSSSVASNYKAAGDDDHMMSSPPNWERSKKRLTRACTGSSTSEIPGSRELPSYLC
jgi:hypothetical protein